MTARRKHNGADQTRASRRERRAFTEEFKREAVRLLHERRATGVSVTQIGRELDVRPDQLRERPWTQT
jgi:transposase-like protein